MSCLLSHNALAESLSFDGEGKSIYITKSSTNCFYEPSKSYVEEENEYYWGYLDYSWEYRWNGVRIASGRDREAPQEVISGGYRYNIDRLVDLQSGGNSSQDETWEVATYGICRTAIK